MKAAVAIQLRLTRDQLFAVGLFFTTTLTMTLTRSKTLGGVDPPTPTGRCESTFSLS